ncbi:MAG: ATP-binding protein [Candidatus Hadarchaeota archaeon]
MTQSNDFSKIILGQNGNGEPSGPWQLSIGSAVGKNGEEVVINSANPHVIFVCGARGSGKSYTMGVIAEELSKTSEIGVAIIDPIGVFWSMKYPNKEEGERKLLEEWGFSPKGVENLSVFIPEGFKSKIPKETYTGTFTFRPKGIDIDDWCLTFGIDRYCPQALLLERAIERVKNGYTRKMGDKIKGGTRDVDPKSNFSIDDLIECINHDRKILSKEEGFNSSTRRALSSRLKAAKDWGIFGKRKKLSDLIRPGRITIFDISFLQENIGALVVGILARKILAARKAGARKEAIKDLKGVDKVEAEKIPPTWLMIDEAHSFAPSSGKTAATDALVEYVKQGRRPGLSAVLSTQQPSALNSKIISQLDILISHQLSFKKDIKEVEKRMPSSFPDDFDGREALKKLNRGTAITADKKINTSFLTAIRPRLSQHEGRERVSQEDWDSTEIIENFPSKEMETENVGSGDKGSKINGNSSPNGMEEVGISTIHEEEEATIVPPYITMEEATELAKDERKRRLKVLWLTEEVWRVSRYYYPFWGTLLDYYPSDGGAINIEVFIDGITGEMVRKMNNRLIRTEGVRKLWELGPDQREVLFAVLKNEPIIYEDFAKMNGFSNPSSEIEALIDMDILEEQLDEEDVRWIQSPENKDIPVTLNEEDLLAAEDIPDREKEVIPSKSLVDRIIEEEKVFEILESFGEIRVIERELFYYPYWVCELASDDNIRTVVLDGVSGKRDEYAEKMLRRRV